MLEPVPLPESTGGRAASELWAAVLRRIPGRDGGAGSAVLAAVSPQSLASGRLKILVPSRLHRDGLAALHLVAIRSALEALAPGTELVISVAHEGPEPTADQLSLAMDEPRVVPTGRPDERFDPRLSFDAFVVGRTNRLAQSAALSIAENIADSYNPLFIHGESGNGKTHLLHAVGLHVREHSPHLDVRYLTLDRFTSEFVDAMKDNRLDAFKRRYRSCAVLLVDDVQFLDGKEGTQEEFFHTLNEVSGSGGRVVLTADRHPGGIATLPARLLSRFKSGLVADLAAPEFETRVAILRKKAGSNFTAVPDEVLEAIASAVTRSVRELEGALVRVVADATLEQRPLDLESARQSLEGFLGVTSRPVTLSRIIGEAAELFGFGLDELCGPSRSRALVTARQITMYVCRSLTDESLPAIARSFGGRDHTTVLHAVRKIEHQMTERSSVRAMVVQLMNRLGGQPPGS